MCCPRPARVAPPLPRDLVHFFSDQQKFWNLRGFLILYIRGRGCAEKVALFHVEGNVPPLGKGGKFRGGRALKKGTKSHFASGIKVSVPPIFPA